MVLDQKDAAGGGKHDHDCENYDDRVDDTAIIKMAMMPIMMTKMPAMMPQHQAVMSR